MPSLFSRLLRRADPARPEIETKFSQVGPLLALHQVGRPVWTPRDYAALAREGYQRNPIVYRAVRLLSEAVASVPWTIFDGEREAPDHPVAALLATPNPRQGGAALLEAFVGHLLVSGNGYLECVSLNGRPRELYALRPDRMRVVPGPDGWPQAYDYVVGANSSRFDMTGDGVPPVLHVTMFNPLDDHYGLPPLEAAAMALDIHNAAGAWHKALLDNAARPSGALVYSGPQGSNLTEQQFERLKEELEQNFSGPVNAGRPLLLEGGLDWRPLSLSPAEMDFVNAKAAAAREIALAFGVPPMLLGLPGDNTYANYAEANRGFWRQSVLPLASRIAQDMARWLAPAYGSGLRLEPDPDRIQALSSEREALWARVDAASFLSEDEKRAAVGYGPRANGQKAASADDDIPHFTVTRRRHWENQPRVAAGNTDGGQWTDGGGGGGGLARLGEGVGQVIGEVVQTAVIGALKEVAIRALSKLFRLPKSPSTPAPRAPSGAGGAAGQSTRDILKPGGRDIGSKFKGAGKETTRTVSRNEFATLQKDLITGARERPELLSKRYGGRIFERPDGTVIGLRRSVRYGDTLEVLLSDDPDLPQGFKVHRR
jgi:HK97 family phage portal protein